MERIKEANIFTIWSDVVHGLIFEPSLGLEWYRTCLAHTWIENGGWDFPKRQSKCCHQEKSHREVQYVRESKTPFFSYHASIDTWRTQEGTKYVLKIRWHPCELSRYVSSQQSLQSSLCPDPTLPFTILPSSGDSRESLQGRSWGLARQRPVSLAASCHQLWNTIL